MCPSGASTSGLSARRPGGLLGHAHRDPNPPLTQARKTPARGKKPPPSTHRGEDGHTWQRWRISGHVTRSLVTPPPALIAIWEGDESTESAGLFTDIDHRFTLLGDRSPIKVTHDVNRLKPCHLKTAQALVGSNSGVRAGSCGARERAGLHREEGRRAPRRADLIGVARCHTRSCSCTDRLPRVRCSKSIP